ncbi:HDOD domain-containing protein [Litoribrevibacter euphylliae]|uniref:HDOD domain-containing protein n=1 Tax=Litoribrevibacter euphylliae TaxID=1834034 RepID=A0ABV7HM40_9GAMM
MWSLDNHYKVYKDLLNGRVKLPSLSKHFITLKTEVDDLSKLSPLNSHPAILEKLSADPDLCQLLVNAANFDRYYGAPALSTIEQALENLSAAQVSEFITLFGIRNLVLTDNLPAKHTIRQLWEESLQIASICTALYTRLGQYNHMPAEPSMLAGLVYHLGTMLLINSFRNKGLATPNLQDAQNIPAPLASNMSSLAAIQWRLHSSVCECALQRNYFQEVNRQPFSMIDIFHMAITHHQNYNKQNPNVVALKDSLPFIKAVKEKLIREEAQHFTQMVDGHALIIFRGLSPLINKFPITSFSANYSPNYRQFG